MISALLNPWSWIEKKINPQIDFELTPNILLTRYPLVFLCYQKNLLTQHEFSVTGQFLSQHGFEVYYLKTHQKIPNRLEPFKNWMQGFQNPKSQSAPFKFHLICDPENAGWIEPIKNQYSQIHTVSFESYDTHSIKPNSTSLKKWLDLAQSLAEYDHIS